MPMKRFTVSKQVANVAASGRAFLMLSTLFLLAAAVSAQELGTGVIRGEVSDPQSAVVHGAQVTAWQETTGLQRNTTTTNSGLFALDDLAPGDYHMKVVAAGFAGYESLVHLEVGQQASALRA